MYTEHCSFSYQSLNIKSNKFNIVRVNIGELNIIIPVIGIILLNILHQQNLTNLLQYRIDAKNLSTLAATLPANEFESELPILSERIESYIVIAQKCIKQMKVTYSYILCSISQ